jgi:hypothetical protein
MHFGDVSLHQRHVICIGNHEDVLLGYHVTETVVGLFDERFTCTHDIDKLLGEAFFAHRPKSAADTSGHDQYVMVFV